MVDVIVIGAGPSGMAVSLNLLRSGRSVLLIEANSFGGQMATSPRLENIPGIKSISGLELSDKMFDQISDLGIEFDLGEVISIEKEVDLTFKVHTDSNVYQSKAVVLANGCSHRSIGIKKEEQFIGKGISYCATCDGAFYSGQETYIIGDANTALQYALMLKNTSTKVHLIALFDHLFADKILIDRVNSSSNIDVTYNMSLIEFLGEEILTGLVFKNTLTNEVKTYSTNNVFIAIGQIPHNDNFKNIVNLDEQGFILTNDFLETSAKGIFAIGDTRKKSVRQVSTALGDASLAAVFIDRYLRDFD